MTRRHKGGFRSSGKTDSIKVTSVNALQGVQPFPCPVCGLNDVLPIAGELRRCLCRRCGTFEITGTMVATVIDWAPDKPRLRAGLSAYLRQTGRQGIVPRLTSDLDLTRIADSYCHTSFQTKLRRVMERYEELTSEAGDLVLSNVDLDYPLFDAASPGEASFLTVVLVEQGLLKGEEYSSAIGLRITANGWSFLQAQTGGAAGTCFVAMAFGTELNDAYENGIVPAVRIDCGFESIRLDRVEHTDNINDKILADIRRSQFLVADFTHHRNGVYFEAGFGLGLGKTVIWTCRSDDFQGRVHFDTRPYNHIQWETPVDLREKLTNRIRAVIPNAKTD